MLIEQLAIVIDLCVHNRKPEAGQAKGLEAIRVLNSASASLAWRVPHHLALVLQAIGLGDKNRFAAPSPWSLCRSR